MITFIPLSIIAIILLAPLARASPAAEQWIAERDQDNSNSITLVEFLEDHTSSLQRPQIEALKKTFELVDTDGNKQLSLTEIESHYFLRPQNVEDHISRADRNHDEALDENEFVNFETALCVLESERWQGETRACYSNRNKLQKSFAWMDLNSDKMLDRIELERAVYANRENHQLPVTAKDYIKAQDTNEDGEVSLEETIVHAKAEMQNMADQLFKFIDRNGDGQIVASEIESRVERA